MRVILKIHPKTGVTYIPKYLLEDGFKGQIDVFGAGPVIVLIHPDADADAIKESLSLVSRDIALAPRTRQLRSFKESLRNSDWQKGTHGEQEAHTGAKRE